MHPICVVVIADERGSVVVVEIEAGEEASLISSQASLVHPKIS